MNLSRTLLFAQVIHCFVGRTIARVLIGCLLLQGWPVWELSHALAQKRTARGPAAASFRSAPSLVRPSAEQRPGQTSLAPFEDWTLQTAATIAKRAEHPNLKFQHINAELLE